MNDSPEYQSIYDRLDNLCKVEGLHALKYGERKLSPRAKFIVGLAEELKIPYRVDPILTMKDTGQKIMLNNIILEGSGAIGIMAHHDIVNPQSENANDNSASIIAAFALKLLSPDTPVFFTDGEEPPLMGVGARHIVDQLSKGQHPDLKALVNLELVGQGGKYFCLEACKYTYQPSEFMKLLCKVQGNPPLVHMPPNDAAAIRKEIRAGRLPEDRIETFTICPLPRSETPTSITHRGRYLSTNHWGYCHSEMDSLDKISKPDMKVFVEDVLYDIVCLEDDGVFDPKWRKK